MEIRIDSAAGIRHEQVFDPEHFQHAHRENHLLRCVTFIIMEPSLHGHDTLAAEHPENQPPGMAGNRRDRKTRNIFIIELRNDLNIVRQAA